MRRRPDRMTVAPLFAATALSYGANCALGAAVAAKLVDTSGIRWLHHSLYTATCISGAAAGIAGWRGRAHPENRRAALALLPAAVPLAMIPKMTTRGFKHPVIALAAAPFIVAGLICSLKPTDRE